MAAVSVVVESAPDLDRLAALETVIERGVREFVAVGLALAEIRDRQLFRVTHASFKAYVVDRWSLGEQWAYGRIYAAQVARAVEVEHVLPAGITADALAPLVPLLNREGPEAVARAWRGVAERFGERRRPPSRSEVRTVLAEAGEPTCAPERRRPPQVGQIGVSLDRALARAQRVRGVLKGRPLPPDARRRAGEFAEKARRLAAELEALADDRGPCAALRALEGPAGASTATAARRSIRASLPRGRQPGGVWCDTHGQRRDAAGVCVDCGVPDRR